MSSCSGMYQNQPVLPLRLDDERGALVAAGVALRPLPVRPQGGLLEFRIPVAQAEAVDDERTLAAGVDDDLRPHLALRFVLGLHPNADGLLLLEEHLQHPRALVNLHAVLAGVVEVELVELAADDLPRLRRLVRLVVPEVERLRELAVLVDELDAVLLDEVARLHLLQQAGALEGEVGIRDHRLADVEAREVVALEEFDAIALLGEQRRDGRAGGPAADHDDIRGK